MTTTNPIIPKLTAAGPKASCKPAQGLFPFMMDEEVTGCTSPGELAQFQRAANPNLITTTLLSDEEIIDQAKEITERYTTQVTTKRFGLKEDKAPLLLALIPPIISDDALRKIKKETLKEIFPNGIPKSVQDAKVIEPSGGFNSSEYFTCLNLQHIRMELVNLDEVCPHEKNHADGALARTILDILYPGEVDKVVRDYFRDKTINGCHLKYSDRPYFPTKDFATHVSDVLDGLLLNFNNYDDLTITTVNHDGKTTGKNLSNPGKEKLGQDIKSHKDFEKFKALYGGSEEDALHDIFNFLDASLNSYAKVSGFNSVNNYQLLKLSKEVVEKLRLEPLLKELKDNNAFIDYARKSAFGYVETTLGNEDYQLKIALGIDPLPDEVFGYLISSEEYDCNMSTANWRIANSSPKLHKQIEERVNLFKLCSRLKELRKRASASSQHIEMVTAVNDLRITTDKFDENELTLWRIIQKLEENYPTVVAESQIADVINALKPLFKELHFERVNCNPAHLNHAYKYQKEYLTERKYALALKMCLEKIGFPNQEVTGEPKVFKQQWIDALQQYIANQDRLLPRLLATEESLNENWLNPVNRLSPDDPIAIEVKEIEMGLNKNLKRIGSIIKNELKERNITDRPVTLIEFVEIFRANSIDVMVSSLSILLGELSSEQLKLPFSGSLNSVR